MKVGAEEGPRSCAIELNFCLRSITQMDMERLAEYAVDACQELFQVDDRSWFDGYAPQTIAYLLENEERFKNEWEQDLKEYIAARNDRDIPVTMRNNSKPQPPKWLYPQIGQEAAYRSISKNLMIAMNKRADEPKPKQVFWEMKHYLERSNQAPVEEGSLMLQREGRYDDLLALCQSDMDNLSAILPEDQKADFRLYARSIFRYRTKYFVDKVENGELVMVKRARWH